MPEIELFQLLLGVIAEIDAQFQFWLTVTFAVLVASYTAGSRLSRRLRAAMALFYLWATAVIVVRYLTAITYYGDLARLAAELGVSNTPETSLWAGVLRMGLFFAGCVATVILVLRGATLEGGAPNKELLQSAEACR